MQMNISIRNVIHEGVYIELFEGPVDLLGTESDGILVLVISDSSLVEAGDSTLGELRRD
jgi:hypothetical protein